MARIISFINFKGGVGKTTCTVEIAVCLAAYHSKRVLLVDLDPQTNATFYLLDQESWVDWVKRRGSLRNLFEDYIAQRQTCQIDQATIRDVAAGGLAIKGLDLLPSHLELITIDERLASVSGVGRGLFAPQAVLRASLADVEGQYDFVLCDCPPNFNLVTQNGLFASEGYLVPTLPDYLSTLGIDLIRRQVGRFSAGMQRTFELIGAPYKEPQPLGIVFNRVRVLEYGPPVKLPRAQAQSIQGLMNNSELKDLIFKGFITESVVVGEAPGGKIPISVSTDPKLKANQAQFRKVTEEFLRRIDGAGGA